jgi:predicted kinase
LEAVIFTGVQASGKTSFYAERFLATHLRISMDLMRTRHRERRFLETCLETGQRFVVDNTNATAAERRPYVEAALRAGYEVVGYEFHIAARDALERNERRAGPQRIPVAGLLGTYRRLEPMRASEGFGEVLVVEMAQAGGFRVSARAGDAPGRGPAG